ncbi:MAG: hypothetical protein ABL970_08800, partial [Nitrospira sp.]
MMKSPRLPFSHRYRVAASLLFLGAHLAFGFTDSAQARKELLTTEEKNLLLRAEQIHLDALVLSSHGSLDAGSVRNVVAARLERLGYHIV